MTHPKENVMERQSLEGIGTFKKAAHVFAGVVSGNRVLELHSDQLAPGPATVLNLLTHWQIVEPQLPTLTERAAAEGIEMTEVQILPPVQPRQIFQAGANYRSHVAEIIISGKAADDLRTDEELRAAAETMMDERARIGSPFFFAGAPTAMCGAHDNIRLVPESQQTDWEAELAVVIGTKAVDVSSETALDYVAGYTVANDISARDLQFPDEHRPLGGDWWRAKNRPTFLPVGPVIVPTYQIDNYRDLRISLKLNDELMQDDYAANMLFDVPTLISQASRITPLLPGDLILTGSPAGNGGAWQRWLTAGDVVEASIDRIGVLRNTCK